MRQAIVLSNVFKLTAPGTILNGPNGQPRATGSTGGTDDDFTNQSTNIAPNQAPGTPIDPDPVTFTNTISSPTVLTNVLLVPDDLTGINTLLTNTTVTITYNGNSAIYNYDGADFVLITGRVITVPSVIPGTPVNYTVTANLPFQRRVN